MRSLVLAAALWCLGPGLAGGALAQGGPPLVTDDPGTPGPGNWEVNTAFTLDRVPGASRMAAPLVDLNHGLGERLQLKVEVPWVVVAEGSSGTRGGIGNPLVGVKWRFLDEAASGVSVSTYPQLGFNLSPSSADRGLAEQGPSLLLPVSAVKTLGTVAVNGEAGLLFRRGDPWAWVLGLALGRVFGKVEALAEVFATGGSRPEDRQVLLNAGARVPLGEASTLLLSAGRSVSDGAGPRHTFVYAGIQLTRKGPEVGGARPAD